MVKSGISKTRASRFAHWRLKEFSAHLRELGIPYKQIRSRYLSWLDKYGSKEKHRELNAYKAREKRNREANEVVSKCEIDAQYREQIRVCFYLLVLKNRQGLKDRFNQYTRARYKRRTVEKRLKDNIRRSIIRGVKDCGGKNGNSSLSITGAKSWEFLREWLESQFEDWMTWENYGVYVFGGEREVAHLIIFGRSLSFDLTKDDQDVKRFTTPTSNRWRL
jgi:hypothetical protein